MDIIEFKKSLQEITPPIGIGLPLEALWHDAKGDWNAAHQAVQGDDSSSAAWVHAYLHRKEGDNSNAGYWYRRGGQTVAEGALEDEWAQIAVYFLSE